MDSDRINHTDIFNERRFVKFTARTSDADEFVHQRLDALLALNSETARSKKLYRSENEKVAAALMTRPLDFRQTYAVFGMLLGTFPPAAFFARFLIEARVRPDEMWVLGLMAIVVMLSATVGYQSGKFVGKLQRGLESESYSLMLFLTPLVGATWGIVAGGAGGLLIFGIGAIFGALLGGVVGALALPVFAILHRLMKFGEVIDRRHFLPLAFGVTFVLSALILGL